MNRKAAVIALVGVLVLMSLMIPTTVLAGRPPPKPSGCTSTSATFTFYIYGSLGKITLGTKTYSSGQSGSITVGCAQTYAIKSSSLDSSVVFYQWTTTSDGQFSDPKTDPTTFIAGKSGGAIQMVLWRAGPPTQSAGAFILSNPTYSQVRGTFRMPSLSWVNQPGSGIDPNNELAIGVGVGGVNGLGWWTMLVASVPQSGPTTFTVQDWRINLQSPSPPGNVLVNSQAVTAPVVGSDVTVTVDYIGGIVYTQVSYSSGGGWYQAQVPDGLDVTTVQWFAAALWDCKFYGSDPDGTPFVVPYPCHPVPSFNPIRFSSPNGEVHHPDLWKGVTRTVGLGAECTYGTCETPIDLLPSYLLNPYEFSIFYRQVEATSPTAPGKPTWPAQDEVDGSLMLSWQSASDTGSGVAHYEVQVQPTGASWSVLSSTVSSTPFFTPYFQPGTYTFRVRAVDAAGNWGAFSPSAAVTIPPRDTTPPSAPGVPTWTAGDESDGAFTLTWTASTDNTGINAYEVQEKVGGGAWQTVTDVLTNSISLTRSPGTYYYQVRAQDYGGNWGPFSPTSPALVVPQLYTLTISVSPTGAGTTTPSVGSHTYTAGTVVTVYETAATGYKRDHWSLDGTVVYANFLTVTMDRSHSVVAYYTNVFSVTVVGADPVGSGSTSPAAGTYSAVYNSQFTVTATPAQNYAFDYWFVSPSGQTYPTPSITVTVTTDMTLSPKFKSAPAPGSHSIVLSYNELYGSVTLNDILRSPGTWPFDGGSVDAEAVESNPCYFFLKWTLDGSLVTSNPLSISMDRDHTLSATFKKDPGCGYGLPASGAEASSPASALQGSGVEVALSPGHASADNELASPIRVVRVDCLQGVSPRVSESVARTDRTVASSAPTSLRRDDSARAIS